MKFKLFVFRLKGFSLAVSQYARHRFCVLGLIYIFDANGDKILKSECFPKCAHAVTIVPLLIARSMSVWQDGFVDGPSPYGSDQ